MDLNKKYLINVNYHPDYDAEPDWQEYTQTDFMIEYRLSLDDWNDYVKIGAIKEIE